MSLISIIVPCYNQAVYLDEALQSVFDQTYQNWECIIVNDGSQDNTEIIAQKWLERDSRFIYLCQENGGLSSARNLGLENAKGDFIQFLDSDDVLDFRKLELSIGILKLDIIDSSNIVVSNFRIFSKNIENSKEPFCKLELDLINFENVLYSWDQGINIPIHCGLFQRNLFISFRFPEQLKAKEDWIMWLTLLKSHVNLVYLNDFLVFYRKHANSMTKEYICMEENYIKAIIFLEKIIPQDSYKNYLIYAIRKKSEQLIKTKNTIENYRNSMGYKLLEKIKSFFLFKYVFKILK